MLQFSGFFLMLLANGMIPNASAQETSLATPKTSFKPLEEPLNFTSLRNWIETRDPQTISELLKALPESYRSHYALMFHSRSLHGSSEQNPRTLLYGKDAKLILTFNGDPAQKGYDQLEIMDFDSETKEFHYREITFPELTGKPGRVKISDPNPEKCLKCHKSPARPIWDTYPLWPGAFGEKAHLRLATPEQEGLKSFLDHYQANPRYRQLVGLKKLADSQAFVAKATYSGAFKKQPNLELGIFLSDMNYQAIAKQVIQAPKFKAFKYVLLAALTYECESVEDYLPAQVRKEFSKNYTQFASESDRINLTQESLKRTRAYPPYEDDGQEFLSSKPGGSAAVKFRYIAEQGLGLSTEDWSTALEKGTYDFTTFGLSFLDLEPFLLDQAATEDSRLKDLHALRSASNKYCSYLKEKSLTSLTQFYNESHTTLSWEHKVFPKPPTLNRCISCHTTGVGPALPFDKPQEMGALLKTKRYPRGVLLEEILFRLSPAAGVQHMPLGLILSDEERLALEGYFRSLAGTDFEATGASPSPRTGAVPHPSPS